MANIEETSIPQFTVESDGADQSGFPQSNIFLRIQASSSNVNNAGRWFYAYNQGKRKGQYACWCQDLVPFGLHSGVSVRDALGAFYQDKNKKKQYEQKPIQPYKATNSWQVKPKLPTAPTVAPVKPGRLHFKCMHCYQHVGAYTLSLHPNIHVKLNSFIVSPPKYDNSPTYPIKKRKTEDDNNQPSTNTLAAIVLEGNNVNEKLTGAIETLAHSTQQFAYKQVPYHNDITHIHLGIKETNLILKQLTPVIATLNVYTKSNIENLAILTSCIQENNKLLKQLLESK